MCDPAVTRYLFPIEVRGIHVALVMYGGSAEIYDIRRRGGGPWGPPHVVALHPATEPAIRKELGSELVDRELSQLTMEIRIAAGEVPLIELETLHRLATELQLISALPSDVLAVMNIAGPRIAEKILSITGDVLSELRTSGIHPIPAGEGDALIEQAIAGCSVGLDESLILYCQTFFEFLDSLIFRNQAFGVRQDSDFYAVSILLKPIG